MPRRVADASCSMLRSLREARLRENGCRRRQEQPELSNQGREYECRNGHVIQTGLARRIGRHHPAQIDKMPLLFTVCILPP
jgi:hypothetical protein